MGALSKSLLLFSLNWLDAQLTLIWVRLNVATEGNALMARLLEHANSLFSQSSSSSAPPPPTFSTAALFPSRNAA